MADLRTKYLGLNLRTPVVVSANPLSQKIDNILQMEDSGAGAVVLFSLFEEQIRNEAAHLEEMYKSTSQLFAEASGFFPEVDDFGVGASEYLELIHQAKKRTNMPIIGSLNGVTPEGWLQYAKEIEQAGADALELNVFFIPASDSYTAESVEQRYIDILMALKKEVSIPIAVKLNPYFSAMANMAKKLEQAGAGGLVLFNRFYQPDFDIYKLKVRNDLDLSRSEEIRLPLLWLAVLSGRTSCSLAATTGIESAEELIKYLLAGADVGMVASTLYRHGISHINILLAELENYMEMMGFKNLAAFRGQLSQSRIANPTAFERTNYIQIIEDKKYRI
jgi:dihydroorotate dehydrogenase (fumarate)